jgi:hypothetical protein
VRRAEEQTRGKKERSFHPLALADLARPIAVNFGMLDILADVISYAKFNICIFEGFRRTVVFP